MVRSEAEQHRLIGTDEPPQRHLSELRIGPFSRFYWVTLLTRNSAALAGMLFLLSAVLLAIFFPAISEHDPSRLDPAERLKEPSAQYWLGTDQLGRDVLTRSIYSARVSLFVGASVMTVSALAGTFIGLSAGYYRRVDTPIMRIMDGFMAFPAILLAIAIMASLGPSTTNVVVALGFVYMPIIARLVRASTLSIKQQPYVEAAKASGVRDLRLLVRHIFPNALSPLIVQCTFIIAFAIMAEAALSFLGAGVPPETPTWGSMLRDGQEVIYRAWWLVLVPGALLFLTVLSLNFIGDGLRDALDPRARQR